MIKSEWNLSDKIMRWFPDGEPNHVVYAEDVREFIKKLSIVLNDYSVSPKQAYELVQQLGKLAGEKLI